MMRIAFCATALLFSGGAFSVGAQEGARASSAASAQSLSSMSAGSLPIYYDHVLAAQGFPNPLVIARIAGHEAIFIVDTGASANVLADWYVRAAGIHASKTDSVARSARGKTAPERLARRIHGEWSDGRRFSLDEAVVVAFPSYFKSLHLGGLVSPQLLAPSGTAAVLDLRVPSLRFVPFPRALSDLRRSTAPTASPDLSQSCRNPGSKLVNRRYLTPVEAAGVTDLMVVDTGATATTIAEDSKIAHDIERRGELGPPSDDVGGEVSGQRIVRNVQLLRGGRVVTVTPSIGKVSAACSGKGALGMDALRDCVLILGNEQMAFSCF